MANNSLSDVGLTLDGVTKTTFTSIVDGVGNLKGVHFNNSSSTTSTNSTSYSTAHSFTYTATTTNPKLLVMLTGKGIDGHTFNTYGQIGYDLQINGSSFLSDQYGTRNEINSQYGVNQNTYPNQLESRIMCNNVTYNSGSSVSVILYIRSIGGSNFYYTPPGSDNSQSASRGTVYWTNNNITVFELA